MEKMNRQQRRAAGLTNTRSYQLDTSQCPNISPKIVIMAVEDLCREYPEVPKGDAAVSLVKTPDGLYKLTAIGSEKRIEITGPHPESLLAEEEERMAKYGREVKRDWTPPEPPPLWKCYTDPRLIEMLERNDPTAPTQRQVKAGAADLMKQFSHFETGEYVMLLPRRPGETRRGMEMRAYPKEKAIVVKLLATDAEEQEAQEFQDREEEGWDKMGYGVVHQRDADHVTMQRLQ
jgi:hypothetical protein